MALSATLEADFGDGGFSLTGTVDGLGGDLDAVAVPDVPLDADGIASAVDGLADVDPSVLADGATVVVGALGAVGVEVPMVDDLLGPLTAVLDAAAAFGELDLDGPAAAFGSAGADLDAVGLDALRSLFGGLGAAVESPGVGALTDLVGALIPGGLDLGTTLDGFGADAQGVIVGVQAFGSLMATWSATSEIVDGARLVESMLTPAEIDALTRRLAGWNDQDLAGLLVGVDLPDPGLIEIVSAPILAMTADIRIASDALTRGLGFGQATLVGLDVAGLVGKLDAATALVSEEGFDAVRLASERVVAALDPVLSLTLPEPEESIEAFWSLIGGQLNGLAGGIDALDPAALASGLTSGLTTATGLVGEIAAGAEAVVVAARAAFESVRQALAAIDLGPITDALDTILGPVQSVLDEITSLVGDAQVTIEAASAVVVDAMNTVRSSFEAAATLIADAFGRIQTALDALGLDNLQQTLEAGIAPIADTVSGIHLAPVFDTANDVIDTTADVVGAVPLGLLPDDAKADLADAVRPVQEIDFQRDVADVLNAKMTEILDGLDTEVLGAIDAAYRDVIAFLESIDPNAPLEEFEQTVFDPFLERLRALDPEELLAPLADALEPIQDSIEGLDLGVDVFGPVEGLIDDLQGQLATLDPSGLLDPVDAQVDEIRTEITTALHIDEIGEWLDEAEEVITGWLARLDPARFVAALDAAYDPLVRDLTNGAGGANPLATAIGMLMEGTGAPVRADAFAEVNSWVNGAAAGATVQRSLIAAAERMEALHAATTSLDLAGLVADLSQRYRPLRDAVLALPADSALRASVELEVLGASPLELLGPFVDALPPYRDALAESATALRRAAGSARSELDAVSAALREALRPLVAITDWLRSIASRFGLGGDLSAGAVITALLTQLTPSVVLEPILEAVSSLIARIDELAVTGVLGPVRESVTDLSAALAAIDLSFVTEELGATFAEVVATLDGLRPSVLLGDELAAVTELQAALAGFDPLGPVTGAVDALKTAIDDGAETLRPTVIFAPVTDIYDQIVDALGALDVRALLDPLLAALDSLALELGDGLDGLAVSLSKLQAALPDPESLAGGGGGSVGVSVGVG